jgi:hypothetical protein
MRGGKAKVEKNKSPRNLQPNCNNILATLRRPNEEGKKNRRMVYYECRVVSTANFQSIHRERQREKGRKGGRYSVAHRSKKREKKRKCLDQRRHDERRLEFRPFHLLFQPRFCSFPHPMGELQRQRDTINAIASQLTANGGRRAGRGPSLGAAGQLGDSGLDAGDARLDGWRLIVSFRLGDGRYIKMAYSLHCCHQ